MHRPFVTTVKFENDARAVMRLEYAVAAVDTIDAKNRTRATLSRSRTGRLHDRKDRRGHDPAGADAQTACASRDAACLNCGFRTTKGERMAIIPHEEICPISEQLLFSLYDAAKRGLPVPVSDVPRERRSSVGLYCYRRSHQNAPADSAESPGGPSSWRPPQRSRQPHVGATLFPPKCCRAFDVKRIWLGRHLSLSRGSVGRPDG